MSYDPMFPIQSRIQALSRELADHDPIEPTGDPSRQDHELHAAGQECARCHQTIEAGAGVRRNASHEWVHEECPVVPAEPVTPPEPTEATEATE